MALFRYSIKTSLNFGRINVVSYYVQFVKNIFLAVCFDFLMANMRKIAVSPKVRQAPKKIFFY